jgi:hypothetical protein
VPTRDSAEAFTTLTAARARLNEITKQLNEVNDSSLSGGLQARSRRAQLQDEWDAAFRAFKIATENFSAVVNRLPL